MTAGIIRIGNTNFDKLRPVLAICLCALFTGSVHANAEQEAVTAAVDNDGVQRVRIVGGEYFFKPDRIMVKANIPVELTLSKEPGVVPHSFAIDAPEAGIVLDQELDSKIKTVTFTPTAAGAYPFYCRHRLLFFKSHRDRGMEGVLEVLP